MKNLKIYSHIIILLISAVSSTAQDKQLDKKLDAMIMKGIADWKIPGMVAVVLKDDKVVFSKTYGVKNLASKAPVDRYTLFNMGSTTKAVVCMAMGILVDQGKLSWEGKVRDYLPNFQLSDSYITEEARIKDLLTHNLGIDQADLLWAIDSASTEETMARFSMARKAYPIRGGFIYNNIMYAIAGEVIRAVSGEHWTTFVTNNILKPLEMNHTKTRVTEIFNTGNYVTPYLNDIEDGVIPVNFNLSDQIGAAGMIWTCSNDVENYLKFLTHNGIYKSDTILKRATFDYLFQPHAFVSRFMYYPTYSLAKPNWYTYGLGWFQNDYKGQKLDFHTGSIGGLIAIAGVMRDKNIAVYVLANLDHAELRHAILYKAIDLYAFNDDSRNWHEEIFNLYDGFRQAAIRQNKAAEESRIPNTRPTLSLQEYEGAYKHEMLGTLTVKAMGDQLEINCNDYLTLKAYHWHYDTFQSDKENRLESKVKINFNINQNGKVDELIFVGNSFKKD